ncbi:MAG: hypothetical protein LBP59_06235 [Planctomycetaceae bacterium]|jgi:hypothetical protein|nr:hypothetical protein [Planctomycetaceae bacterium]
MKIFKRRFFVTIILFVIVNLLNFTLAQNKPENSKPNTPKLVTPKPAAPNLDPQVQQIAGLNAKFIVALIQDGLGGAWIGTEDDGVFHYQVDGKISQFTTKNGLGDNNGYGLTIDKLGRLWVGHLNTGVSVFNGKDWKNYDVVD